jgi:hypothetical protein
MEHVSIATSVYKDKKANNLFRNQVAKRTVPSQILLIGKIKVSLLLRAQRRGCAEQDSRGTRYSLGQADTIAVLREFLSRGSANKACS